MKIRRGRSYVFVSVVWSLVQGAGLYVYNSTGLSLRGISATHCASSSYGGAISIVSSSISLSNVAVSSSRAAVGGGISLVSSTVSLATSSVISSRAATYGGGIFASSSVLNFTAVTISGNAASGQQGGGMFLEAVQMTLRNSSVANNTAASTVDGMGGGAALLSSWLTDTFNVWHNNSATVGGGAVVCTGLRSRPSAAISSTSGLVTGNHGGSGGAYFLENCPVTWNGLTVSANKATGAGGGAVYVLGNALVSVNATIVTNNSASLGHGGAFFINSINMWPFCLSLSNSSVVRGNSAPNGGGGSVYWLVPSMTTATVRDADAFSCLTCSDNDAAYGKSGATNGIALNVQSNTMSNPTVQNSLQTLTGTLVYQLVDFYGQVVASDNSSTVAIGPSSRDVGLTGQFNLPLSQGVVNFSGTFKISGIPGSLVNLTVSCSLNSVVLPPPETIYLRSCMNGEVNANSMCTACSLGTYAGATDTECRPCPGGSFGNRTGLSSPNCSGVCAVGYWCPPYSVTAKQVPCGSASLYCPAKSSAPVAVSSGYYSTADQSSQERCNAGSYCSGGVQSPCPRGSYQTDGASASW